MGTDLVPVKWTHFWDMHSGGRTKIVIDDVEYNHVFIEAAEPEARIIFYHRFGHSADRVSCTCCGEDYSVNEGDSLQQLSGYHRGCQSTESGYIEERDRSSDKYVLGYVRDWLKRGETLDKRTVALYNMAIDKSTTDGERRNAMDKLMKIDKYPGFWRAESFVPFEEFEKKGLLQGRFSSGREPSIIIRSADIKPEERIGYVPEQGYVWR